MRAPQIRAAFAPEELVVDLFAGGGGASEGIERAIGRPVDIAINHDPEAIEMHRINHPETRHYCEDIYAVDPVTACGTRTVALLWASPECTHFSRAKGTAPKSVQSRSLAWVVVDWARKVKPKTIIVENVEEWETWGPLDDAGQPDPARAGETFREWIATLSSLGYRVDFKSLVAADYGTPTIRKRLYLVAQRNDVTIVWPEPTHGKGRAEAWRPASEIIDWSLPCRSIFGRKRPLAEATLARIARGVQRYVIDAAKPFVIPVTHQGDARVHSVDEPLRTVTGAHRGEFALVGPHIVPVKSWGGGGNEPRSLDEPMRTVTASKRGEFAVVEPFIVRHGHYSTKTGIGLGYIKGGPGSFRGQRLQDPLATVCATNDKHLVVPLITKHYGGMVGHEITRTLGTVTATDHHALTAAFLTKFYGTATGAPLDVPCPTITAGGERGGGHIGEVRAFMIKYYGASGQAQTQGLHEPLHTVTTKARFGLGVVEIGGEPWRIVDIGMRMLDPHELFAAQGFPVGYVIRPTFNGKPMTKTAQTKLAGNSVCPPVAESLVVSCVTRRLAA